MIKDKGGNIETRCQGNWQQVENMAEQNLSKETEKRKLNMIKWAKDPGVKEEVINTGARTSQN